MNFTCPVCVKFDCNRCALCCGDTKQKTRHILLLETEANKIGAYTSVLTPDFSTEIKDTLPYIYEMKKTSEGKCIFLKDKKCLIYRLRPLVCRFYPFELKFDQDKGHHNFDFTLECPGINQGKVLSQKDFKKLFQLAKKSLG